MIDNGTTEDVDSEVEGNMVVVAEVSIGRICSVRWSEICGSGRALVFDSEISDEVGLASKVENSGTTCLTCPHALNIKAKPST
jgi:hypothetical protein